MYRHPKAPAKGPTRAHHAYPGAARAAERVTRRTSSELFAEIATRMLKPRGRRRGSVGAALWIGLRRSSEGELSAPATDELVWPISASSIRPQATTAPSLRPPK
jgi:hypothetical protein